MANHVATFATLKMTSPDPSFLTNKVYETMKSEKGASLADVTLITSDDVRIPAVRVLLSASSPYFDKLFSSEFAEKKLSEVPVSITSSLLREVLEFLYTDDCSLIRRIRNQANDSRAVDCKEVETAVELAHVADYIDVDRLLSRCKEAIRCMTQISSHFACVTLRSLRKGRSSWGEDLIKEAVEATVDDLEESLLVREENCDLKCGLLHLDEQAVEDSFSSFKETEAEEDTLFQALIVWASGGAALRKKWTHPSWTDPLVVDDVESVKMLEERIETAKRIATWFDVSSLKPRFLSNIVEPSNLVERDVLYNAYKRQSTELEERLEASESKSRSNDRTLRKLKREVKEIREKL